MTVDAVTFYLNNILTPRLRKYGVSEEFLFYTVNVVKVQAFSLLRHWDEREFRNTVLLLGIEEGSFYEPVSKLDVRCFVVVAIRNSPIETIQSNAYKAAGLMSPISSLDVKELTSEAVRYFSAQDFATLCEQAKASSLQDLSGDVMRRYPISWAALSKVANCTGKMAEYKRVESEDLFGEDGFSFSVEKEDVEKIYTVCFDGYDLRVDQELAKILQTLAEESDGAFIVESFKTLTRNVEKLFRVMEFLLSRDKRFVTANIYLRNGHVERRAKPLRAGHTTKEMENNLLQTAGLGYEHKLALNGFTKNLRKRR